MTAARPFTFDISFPEGIPSRFDRHLVRRLSDMRGYYANGERYQAMLAQEDTILYEVYQVLRPESSGELLHGLTILHPGTVGDEYFMTKGHFHAVIETAEVYCCLRGHGMMVMETPGGDWAVEELHPNQVLYVPPLWAHRSVNTGRDEDLVTLYVYPGHAGHDYGSIQERGFRKLVLERNGGPHVVGNPNWQR